MHGGSSAVAGVFLTVAIVVLCLGVLGGVGTGIYVHEHLNTSVGTSVLDAVAAAAGGLLIASLLAFFGFVLDLLVEIAESTQLQIATIEDLLTAVEALEPSEPELG